MASGLFLLVGGVAIAAKGLTTRQAAIDSKDPDYYSQKDRVDISGLQFNINDPRAHHAAQQRLDNATKSKFVNRIPHQKFGDHVHKHNKKNDTKVIS